MTTPQIDDTNAWLDSFRVTFLPDRLTAVATGDTVTIALPAAAKAAIKAHIASEVEEVLERLREQMRGEDPHAYRPNDMISLRYTEELIDEYIKELKSQAKDTSI